MTNFRITDRDIGTDNELGIVFGEVHFGTYKSNEKTNARVTEDLKATVESTAKELYNDASGVHRLKVTTVNHQMGSVSGLAFTGMAFRKGGPGES